MTFLYSNITFQIITGSWCVFLLYVLKSPMKCLYDLISNVEGHFFFDKSINSKKNSLFPLLFQLLLREQIFRFYWFAKLNSKKWLLIRLYCSMLLCGHIRQFYLYNSIKYWKMPICLFQVLVSALKFIFSNSRNAS